MSMRLTGRRIEISPQLKDYIDRKMAKLDRYSVHIVDSELILYYENHFAWAEGILHLKNDKITTRVKAESLRKAVHDLTDKLVRQMERFEGRHRSKIKSRRTPGPGREETAV
ncbi:MAG: ribosome-associated translation inhibitor RaiA [Candidatus Stahlbacteria bacterium]|nr:MAG: ribosome-associated translation inhibitor RaiA [Candidatus Stahlbacteria bacterium]